MKNIYDLNKNLSCDFLIIGSGAGGSVAAKELASKGKDCILLEEGHYFEMDHFKGSIKKFDVPSMEKFRIHPDSWKSKYSFW